MKVQYYLVLLRSSGVHPANATLFDFEYCIKLEDLEFVIYRHEYFA